MNDLIKRLRGKYSVGDDGVYEDRDFGHFTPLICEEAATKIEELQEQLNDHKDVYKDHQRVVRELDAVLGGDAIQPSLIDLFYPVQQLIKQLDEQVAYGENLRKALMLSKDMLIANVDGALPKTMEVINSALAAIISPQLLNTLKADVVIAAANEASFSCYINENELVNICMVDDLNKYAEQLERGDT